MDSIGTILVVDDEVDILEMIEVGLAGEGYALLLANGGLHALTMFDADSVDLVICDISMPPSQIECAGGAEMLLRASLLPRPRAEDV